MNKSIKAIVFDFGGVIELFTGGSAPAIISDFLNVPKSEFLKEYFKHNHLCNAGNMSWKDVILKTVSFFDDTEETRNKVLLLIEESDAKKKINLELLDVIVKLRQSGLKVAIFSNAKSNDLREKLDAHKMDELFDEIIISEEIGFQKPHKEAFDVLFEKLNVEPQEVIFIDDSPKSLEKAEEIGYHPVLFKNNEQLMDDLKNLGILI